jgi:1-deoxy-D-xylulose-5-phosphate reductoisomerase
VSDKGESAGGTAARRRITILGATGSVGRSTLDLIARAPECFDVLALTARRDVVGLAEAAKRVGARRAVVSDPACLPALREALAGTAIDAAAGEAAVLEAAALGADWTMAAIVGTAGLEPCMAALERGGTVALANKEALVSAGAVMIAAARRSGAVLLPVDSEHNAIFQCFDAARAGSVRRIILTASGGPFRTRSIAEMREVTPAQAVAHPNWSMGAKISVDSATLMNKGLELIEASHLFPIDPDRLEIVIHPESVVHGLVEYEDGSVLAQLGAPDMRIPIAFTLAWPERMGTPCARLDLVALGALHFEAPDLERFPALVLARDAMREGGGAPAVLNAANEVAVAAFLEGGIGFLDIFSIAAEVLRCYSPPPPEDIEAVLAVDREARARAGEIKRRFEI